MLISLLRRIWILVFVVSANAFAGDPPVYSHPTLGAIKGADVVAYYALAPGDDAVIGSDDFTYVWNGATWKFASAENRDKFIANPEKYAPQYGGYCAFAVAHGYTTSIRPDSWKIVDDKLYLNYSRISYLRWKVDMEEKIKEADANWPAVLDVCEKRGNCK
ncbi:YHS domain-containing protein [Teredinibacter turnerae T7901]|uniref:YHS domain-containing protein n=1 Tax=Teredinibacter turnerae (strain ATCC 39867 / T7901) TaxID=377629 RepID=C5BKV1_TERTT|nr:YHS domain-containing (seleno)protein [Teredinibacter turnerae]ACR10825.1 YHS domain-containing protein [Teredinibacter turnerae T7901]